MTRPPTRLVNDPAVTAALRSHLQRVREADGGYDVAHGLSRLQAALELPAPAALDGARAGSIKLAGAKLTWLGALGAAAVVGAVLVREAPAPAGRPAPHTQAPPPPAAAARTLEAAAGDDVRREIEQLAQIRALLHVQPEAAHALAQRGAREFPRGALREEREALDALALARLGERARAREAARTFLERYPHSPLRQAIEPLLREAP